MITVEFCSVLSMSYGLKTVADIKLWLLALCTAVSSIFKHVKSDLPSFCEYCRGSSTT